MIEQIREFSKTVKVLVVGDLMLDVSITGNVKRVSQEAPVPILNVSGEPSETPGGAANVALNVRGLIDRGRMREGQELPVRVVGVTGSDAEGGRLQAELSNADIDINGIVFSGSRPTTTKTRFGTNGQQMLRVDREETAGIFGDDARAVADACAAGVEWADLIVLSDYDKGLFRYDLASTIIEAARAAEKVVCAGPKPQNVAKFKRAAMLSMNQDEALQATGLTDPLMAASELATYTGGGRAIITLGAKGAIIGSGNFTQHVSAEQVEVADPCGAGDTFLAAWSTAYAWAISNTDAQITEERITWFANLAASSVVTKHGVVPVNWNDLA